MKKSTFKKKKKDFTLLTVVKLHLLLGLFFTPFSITAQYYTPAWEKNPVVGMNNQVASIFALDSQGNTIVAGAFTASISINSTTLTNSGQNDIFMIKYAPDGSIIWSRKIGGTGDDLANSITVDNNDNIYVAGSFSSPSLNFGNAVSLSNAGTSDFFVLKMNSDGDALWAKKSGTSKTAKATALKTDANGNLFLAGTFKGASIMLGSSSLASSGDVQVVFVAKINSSGNFSWAINNKNALESSYINSLTTDVLGNVIACGYFNCNVFELPGNQKISNTTPPDTTANTFFGDGYVFKLNAIDGNVLWLKSISGSRLEKTNAIVSDASGNLYVSGYTQSDEVKVNNLLPDQTTETISLLNPQGFGNTLGFITKLNSSGKAIWMKASENLSAIPTVFGVNSTDFLYFVANKPTEERFRIKYLDLAQSVLSEQTVFDSNLTATSAQLNGFGFIYSTNILTMTSMVFVACGTIGDLPAGYNWYSSADATTPLGLSSPLHGTAVTDDATFIKVFYGVKTVNGVEIPGTRKPYTFTIKYKHYYRDVDHDGYGVSTDSVIACAPIAGYADNTEFDCDDDNPLAKINLTLYLDADGDGYGNQTAIEHCGPLTGYVINSDDCDDGNSSLHGAYYYPDLDHDGFTGAAVLLCTDTNSPPFSPPSEDYFTTPNGLDCNDNNSNIYPGKAEVYFDTIDQDCNGFIDDSVITTASIASANTTIYCKKVGATEGYKFLVVAHKYGISQTFETTDNYFKLSQLATPAYSRNDYYTISVALKKNGVWKAYGPGRELLSPYGSSNVGQSQCGRTIGNLDNYLIYLKSYADAAGYLVTISNGESPYTFETPTPNFNINTIPNSFKGETTRLDIWVQVKGANGIYSEKGSSCFLEIKKPVHNPVESSGGSGGSGGGGTVTPAKASIATSQCGGVLKYLYSAIFATTKTGVTNYTFEVTNLSTSQVITHSTTDRFVVLKRLATGFATYNTMYAIRVKWNNEEFGNSCNVLTPLAAVTRGEDTENENPNLFEAVGYPNPFKSTFSLSFDSLSPSAVSFHVFDLLGRVIEQRTVDAENVTNQIFGQNYPSGVYLILINQDDKTKTLKIIKN